MITVHTYWMGRDATHAEELTDEINRNAQVTVDKVNELLRRSGHSDIDHVNSGWRPQAVNDATSNSALKSAHLSAQAADIPDADRTLADWVVDNRDVLEELDLYIEHPGWTPTWLHAQTVPPRSGRRIFIPNAQPPADPDFILA